MDRTSVRIISIEIKNFKNVVCGRLNLENAREGYQASVLGLYGQNGSGKTALIDVLELLKFLLTGKAVPQRFTDYINVDSEAAVIKYGFKVQNHDVPSAYTVFYEVSMRRELADGGDGTENPAGRTGYRTALYGEVLSFAYTGPERKLRLSSIIDTRTAADRVFVPKARYEALIGNDKGTTINLLVAKQLALTTSRSFIFSSGFLNKLCSNCQEEFYLFPLKRLVSFGNCELFVIKTANAGLISLDALPLAFNYVDKATAASGNMLLTLNEPSLIPEEAVTLVQKVIDSMSIVLLQLVPGLTLTIKELGTQFFSNGTRGRLIQLMAKKGSQEIPLRHESDGIKKLISVLQLLIVMYNKPSMTVAIDELDSGVFEYLLGEMLRILSQQGRGQLIFTSHNLRPLETLDKGFIAFTTTNPRHRYIRMSNVKTSNNLRDFYYRDIILSEQSEQVYEVTNNSEIALAFREAGAPNGS